ncbi:hypothetical protein [Curtobacterium sp. PhB115]|uniref:hypothetical protein n=1 Tax=Curtobacterium sp. PhB115 TaxID=2485173 RepID=UPI001C8485E6|nr:hypothetical protein [Curtobacterium sp. PhB115]
MAVRTDQHVSGEPLARGGLCPRGVVMLANVAHGSAVPEVDQRLRDGGSMKPTVDPAPRFDGLVRPARRDLAKTR